VERIGPSHSSDERTTLIEFLDQQSATLVTKVEGLSQTQMACTLGPSPLTLAGLIKHMAYVEDWWFQEQMLGQLASEPWAGAPYEADPDWELNSAVDDDSAKLLELYVAACQHSRAVVAEIDPARHVVDRAQRSNRQTVQPPLDHGAHDRGDRLPQRTRGCDPGVHRR